MNILLKNGYLNQTKGYSVALDSAIKETIHNRSVSNETEIY